MNKLIFASLAIFFSVTLTGASLGPAVEIKVRLSDEQFIAVRHNLAVFAKKHKLRSASEDLERDGRTVTRILLTNDQNINILVMNFFGKDKFVISLWDSQGHPDESDVQDDLKKIFENY